MSVERDRFRKGFGIMAEKDRMAKVRPPVMQGRRTEATVDANQRPIRESIPMRAPTGEFYFLLGYSTLGGGDVLRPDP